MVWFALLILGMFPTLTTAQTTNGFCTRLSDAYQRATIAAAAEEQKFSDIWEARVSALAKHQKDRDESLNESRQSFDQEQAARLEQLSSLAETDSQKQAVADFKNIQSEALSDYRESVDDAVNEFRTETNAAIAKRRQAIADALARFKNVVAAAASKASADCTQGVSPQTINTNFKNTVVAAREQLVFDRRGTPSLSETLTQATQQRTSAFTRALKTFRSRIEEAGAKLQTAFE